MRKYRILFVGPLKDGSTTLHRKIALADLGHEVHGIDTSIRKANQLQSLWIPRLVARLYRAGLPVQPRYPDEAGVNQSILTRLQSTQYDILWLEKGLTVKTDTFRRAKADQPAMSIIGYSPDDMKARHNHSFQFLKHLPFYDLFVTTKSYNVHELMELGCPAVVFIDNGYDPHTHRPLALTIEEQKTFGGPVGFIGSYEKYRAESMVYLARLGVPVRVYGNRWRRRSWLDHPNLSIEGKDAIGDDYARIICSFDINLHFLRRLNRDKQTTRSVEIPACGAFMLAERSDEHQRLFEDGEEAVFFSSNEELYEKIKYYLEHPEERRRIAQAGLERCRSSRYSNQERLRQVFLRISELRKENSCE